ncbi:MAG TPA: TROVE domain-containing protein [Puia sp.]|nr:TROVE domain-containing protein [Puia sp.]
MKFNVLTRKQKVTVNHEGAKAFVLTPALELYTAVATAGLSDKFYEKSDETLARIQSLIRRNDPAFVSRLAVYAREQMYLRSIPLVLAVELAAAHKGDSLVSDLVTRIVQRADEITELLAYYTQANGRTGRKKLGQLSKQVQKGLAEAFNKFGEYQFAKYNRDSAVSLKDALFLVHPKAKDDAQQALFDKIVRDELETPYTWEVELSKLGQQKFESGRQKDESKSAKWEELIQSNKLGYMALVRNLRNILEAGVSKDAIKKVCAYLTNPKAVATSKQLPFRYLSAYRELKTIKSGYTGLVLEALEEAVQLSAVNIAGYDEDTKVVIAADVSGSMQKAVSANSKVMNYDIGVILAMLLQSRCADVITGMFGNTWKMIPVPKKNILGSVQEFYRREGEVGYATNGYLVIKDLLQRGEVVDKVVLFTDCELWNSAGGKDHIDTLWTNYKRMAPGAKLYLFDLAGYGKSPLRLAGRDVFLIAGWSDKIFQVLKAIEDGGNALDEINKIEL